MSSNKMGVVAWAERITSPAADKGTTYELGELAKVFRHDSLRSDDEKLFFDTPEALERAAKILEREIERR